MYNDNENYGRINKEISGKFRTVIGVRQGCVLISLVFLAVIDDAVKKAKKKMTKVGMLENGGNKNSSILVSLQCGCTGEFTRMPPIKKNKHK